MKRSLFFILVMLFLFSCTEKGLRNDYPISPVPFTQVKVKDEFWAKRIRTNHQVTIPIAIKKVKKPGG